MSNPIGWCDMTWNPVWGCSYNQCKYCYARRIAKRFAKEIAWKEANYRTSLAISKAQIRMLENGWKHFIPDSWLKIYFEFIDNLKNFRPTFLESRITQPLPKKPQRIFLDSMSDIASWEEEWYEKILQKINENPQHTFIILTKRPEIYKKYIFPGNVWLGVTITEDIFIKKNIESLWELNSKNNKWFISFEPIINITQKSLIFSGLFYPDWIIVGPETGGKMKYRDKLKKIINSFYDIKGIPVYMKSGCSKIIDTPLRQEWPEK